MREEVFEKPYRKVNEFLIKAGYVGAVTLLLQEMICALNIQACK
jgi:hypothetical protein